MNKKGVEKTATCPALFLARNETPTHLEAACNESDKVTVLFMLVLFFCHLSSLATGAELAPKQDNPHCNENQPQNSYLHPAEINMRRVSRPQYEQSVCSAAETSMPPPARKTT